MMRSKNTHHKKLELGKLLDALIKIPISDPLGNESLYLKEQLMKSKTFDTLLKNLLSCIEHKVCNIHIINILINKLVFFKQEKKADQLFHFVSKVQITDEHTYSSMIRIAGNRGDIEYAKKIYNEALTLEKANVVTHTNMIQCCGQNDCLDLALIAYENAVTTHSANDFTHNTIIDLAGKNAQMDIAVYAYNNAIDTKTYNAFTHNTMINIAGKNGRMDLVRSAYLNAHLTQAADIITYNSMIDSAGRNGSLDLAISAYSQVMKLGIADVYSYTSMTATAIKNNKLNLAMKTYNEALVANQLTPFIHRMMMDAVTQINSFELMFVLYNNATNLGFIKDATTHINMIKLFGDNNRMDLALFAYNNALLSGLIDIGIFNTMIQVSGSKGLFQVALNSFYNALNLKIDNNDTYKQMADIFLQNKITPYPLETYRQYAMSLFNSKAIVPINDSKNDLKPTTHSRLKFNK